MSPKNLDQNIKFTIMFILFYFLPNIPFDCFVLIANTILCDPMGVLECPGKLLLGNGARSVCFNINHWYFYNLLAFSIVFSNL